MRKYTQNEKLTYAGSQFYVFIKINVYTTITSRLQKMWYYSNVVDLYSINYG